MQLLKSEEIHAIAGGVAVETLVLGLGSGVLGALIGAAATYFYMQKQFTTFMPNQMGLTQIPQVQLPADFAAILSQYPMPALP